MSNLIEWGGDRGEFCIIFQTVTLGLKVTDQRGEYEDYRRVRQIENAETTGRTLPPAHPPSFPLLSPFPFPSLPRFHSSFLFVPPLSFPLSCFFELEILQKAEKAGVSGLGRREKCHHSSERSNAVSCLHETGEERALEFSESCTAQWAARGTVGNLKGPGGLLPHRSPLPRRMGRAQRRSCLGSAGWRAERKGCLFRSSQARNFTEVRHTLPLLLKCVLPLLCGTILRALFQAHNWERRIKK